MTQKPSTLLTTEGVAACERACLHDVRLTGRASLQNVSSIFISARTGGIGRSVCGHAGVGCAPAHIQYGYLNFLPKHCACNVSR